MNPDKAKKIKKIPEVLSDIPSLSAVASRALHIIADDSSSLEELKKVISLDQSFSSRLLRVANSPYYGRSRSINDVTDAIIRIGFTTVKAFVFAASLKDLCRTSDATDKLLWEHNMAVSMGSTAIAEETGILASGAPFIHGLLHDIGKVIINQAMRDKYEEVICRSQKQNISFIAAENEVLSYDHCDVGGYVATSWGLPDSLAFVIANHHKENLLGLVKDAELKKTILIVKAADALCSELGIGLDHRNDITDEEWKFLKLSSRKKRDKVRDKIEAEYPLYRDFVLGIGPSRSS